MLRTGPRPSRVLRVAFGALLAVFLLAVAAVALFWLNLGRVTMRAPPPDDRRSTFRVLHDLPPIQTGTRAPLNLRAADLASADLRSAGPVLLDYASFDGATRWPDVARMPDGFDPAVILERAKDPGLGLRALHAAGVTGRGIAIGLIDFALLRTHVEYADRLRHYEEIEPLRWFAPRADFHASAVVSIAAGRTTGVAPEADIYFVAALPYPRSPFRMRARGFWYCARALRRLLEINASLPPSRKIRVVSISVGWDPHEEGYAEMTAAVAAAEAAGVFVMSSNSFSRGFYFHGLGRDPRADPDNVSAYGPGSWWRDRFVALGGDLTRTAGWTPRPNVGQVLLVPMDSRTFAAPTGAHDYAFDRTGGWSWSIPYLAGLYALAAQVRPDVTPELFWRAALDTGARVSFQDDGRTFELAPVINPVRLIAALQATSPPTSTRSYEERP